MEKEEILSAYSDYLLDHQERPKSMHHFAKHLEVGEQDIYAHFASFEAMESGIMAHFVENARDLTIEQASNDEAFTDQRTQLVTFYLTLVEVLKANRSLVLLLLPKGKEQLQGWKNLKSSKTIFLDYVRNLNIKIEALSFIPSDKVKEKSVELAAWGQFVTILSFWLKDESPDFERTDIFIEKSLKLSFDISDSTILQSIVDLGKFVTQSETVK
ncbi:MAG: TetR family transcriptional regulator C-terminal domain-containing protein [bacterium]|nr:TetR family transcriptional regulator C-terminal domain-containing protein [bacterium]